MIKQLNALRGSDSTKYGNKAAMLGELLGAGINVPQGFALSSEVYTQFWDLNNISFRPEDYLAYNGEITESILRGRFPDCIVKELKEFFKLLNSGAGNKAYAVRSSALCEDSGSFSMAGVFNSFIGLNTFEEAVQAIRKCYASLFSDKALSMAVRLNIPLESFRMGVIVQEFVEGAPSGVAFSTDTVQMDPETIVINAVDSTCADYVDGHLPSSMYKIRKNDCKLIESQITPQSPALSESGISILHKNILDMEKSMGKHLDIEWTFAGTELYVLQARPITTFRSKTFPKDWFKADDVNDTLMLTEDKALTPLQQDIKAAGLKAAHKGFEYSSKGKNYRYRICNGYCYTAVDERDWVKRAEFRQWLVELLDEGKNIFQDLQLPEILPLREELEALLQKEPNLSESGYAIKTALNLFKLSNEIHISAVDGGIVPLEAFEEYCRSICGNIDRHEFYELVYGVSKLSEERQAVIDIALEVKADKDLTSFFETCKYDEILYAHLKCSDSGKKLLRLIDAYLREYGLISVNGQWQAGSHVQAEKPWCVISKIRACLNVNNVLFFKSREECLKNKKVIIKRLTSAMNETEKKEFYVKLKGAEKAFLVNDDHCFFLDLTAAGYLRLALVKTARLFRSMAVIEKEEDMELLKLDEVFDIIESVKENKPCCGYQDIIRIRKNIYNLESKTIPPQYLGNPLVSEHEQEACSMKKQIGEADTMDKKQNIIMIKGVSGLRKKVTGKVKVIKDSSSPDLSEPAILILKNGHTCYFLPYIDKIKGLVYDQGSPFDHPGILARELMIPSLYNTGNATSLFKDGDEVELDGINEYVILQNSLVNI